MKTQPTEWKKIFASDMINKELIPNIYKLFIPLSIKKQHFFNSKMGGRPESIFFQRQYTDG